MSVHNLLIIGDVDCIDPFEAGEVNAWLLDSWGELWQEGVFTHILVLVVKFHCHVAVRDSIELLQSAIEDGPLLLFLEFGIKPILLVEEIDLVPFLVIFIDRI